MTINKRAYSIFQVKAIDKARRTFSGWATTPALDRAKDTIDPLGAKFTNPLVLLHQHDSDEPVGQAVFGKPTAKGIPFDATIPQTDSLPDGELKDRLDTAWGEIELGLVRAVSVGFRPLKYAFNEDGGIEYQETEIYELSVVSIPCNQEATITSIKSMDAPLAHDIVRKLKELDCDPLTLEQLEAVRTQPDVPGGKRSGSVFLRKQKPARRPETIKVTKG